MEFRTPECQLLIHLYIGPKYKKYIYRYNNIKIEQIFINLPNLKLWLRDLH